MDSQISFKTKAINFHSFEQYGFYTKNYRIYVKIIYSLLEANFAEAIIISFYAIVY